MAFDPDAYLSKSEPSAPTPTKGFDPDAYLSKADKPVVEDTKQPVVGSRLHNIGRTAIETAPSAAFGLAGFGAGLEAGAFAGALTGPAAPVMVPVLGFAGGLGGAFLASGAAQKVTGWLHEAFAPDDYKQRQVEKQQRPYGTFAAELGTNLLGMSPKTAPQIAGKGIEAMLSKPTVQRGLSSGLQMGIEAGSEYSQEGKIDPVKVLASGAAGAAMPGFNPAGKVLFKAGQAPVKSILSTSKAEVTPPVSTSVEPKLPEGATPEEKEAFLKKVQTMKAEKESKAPLVEAAIRNKETGEIERMGPKHDQARKEETKDTHEEGFVDELGNFHERTAAVDQAKRAGQIPEDHVLELPPGETFGLHTGDLRKAGVEAFKLADIPDSVEGIPIVTTLDKVRADGSRVGATTRRDANGEPLRIDIDVDHLYTQFKDKPWTKPKVEGVEALPEDAFKTPQEWVDFVLQHEAEHVKNPKVEGQTKGEYEDQINKAALKTLAEKKARAPASAEPVPTPEPVVDRTKTDPRDVKDEQEFFDIASDIYAQHGETEATKFFEGYQEYKKTWSEPVKETEKFVGTNINNKLADSRIIYNESRRMMEAVTDPARREAIAEAVDRGDLSGLNPEELAVAKQYQDLVKQIGDRAVKEGVVKGLLEDYVTHILDWAGAPPGAREEFIRALLGTSSRDPSMKGMSTESKFGKQRVFKTFADLEAYIDDANARIAAAGKSDFRLKLKTKDIAEIYKEYASSMQKAIENKRLIDNLKQVRNVNGESLVKEITPESPLPEGWEIMDSPQFAGYAIHPDMVPALKFVFDAGPGDLMKAFGAISQLTKRINVIGSFFHAKSLMEVLSSSNIPLWTPIKEAIVLPLAEKGIKATTGKNIQLSAITKAVEQFKNGGLGDNVDKWIREGGVQLEMPEDVSSGILSSTGKFADSMIGKFGPKTRILEKSLTTTEKYTLGYFDKFTWDFLHTGGKIMVADGYLAKARRTHVENSQKAIEKAKKITDEQLNKQALEASKDAGWDINDDAYRGPEENKRLQDLEYKNTLNRLKKQRDEAIKEQPFDEAKARKEIGSFVNDSFGGLNWFKAATETQNEFGKRIAMAAYSPAGRRGLQIALFAPDWTLSTLRAFTSALPKELNPTKWQPVEGIKGMITPTTKADYARLYQFKTALTYFTLLNAINMMTANRPIWENKDPTRIEWPDGTSMQAMKHAMEPYHWIMDPDKTFANKLGFIPKAIIVGVGGVEYASPAAQKLVDQSAVGRLEAVGAMVAPFQFQAAGSAPEGEGFERAALGTLGFPVYGSTPEQKKQKRAEREKALKQQAKEYREREAERNR